MPFTMGFGSNPKPTVNGVTFILKIYRVNRNLVDINVVIINFFLYQCVYNILIFIQPSTIYFLNSERFLFPP